VPQEKASLFQIIAISHLKAQGTYEFNIFSQLSVQNSQFQVLIYAGGNDFDKKDKNKLYTSKNKAININVFETSFIIQITFFFL
jgi:hypothetical protein